MMWVRGHVWDERMEEFSRGMERREPGLQREEVRPERHFENDYDLDMELGMGNSHM